MKPNASSSQYRVFRSPLTQVLGDLLISAIIISALYGGIFLFSKSWAITCLILIPLIFLVQWLTSGPFHVIRVADNGIRLSGLCFSKQIGFEQIGLVRLGSLVEKIIDIEPPPVLNISAGSKNYKIRLKPKEAKESLRLILEKAPEAGGLDYSGIKRGRDAFFDTDNITEIAPGKPSARYNEAMLKNARNLVFGGIICIIFFVFLLYKIVAGEAEVTIYSEYIAVVSFFIGGIRLIGTGIAKRRQYLPERAKSAPGKRDV